MPVTGTGTGVAPILTISPARCPFGTQPVGITSGTQTVTLMNTGSSLLNLSGIAITGNNSTNFGFYVKGANPCPYAERHADRRRELHDFGGFRSAGRRASRRHPEQFPTTRRVARKPLRSAVRADVRHFVCAGHFEFCVADGRRREPGASGERKQHRETPSGYDRHHPAGAIPAICRKRIIVRRVRWAGGKDLRHNRHLRPHAVRGRSAVGADLPTPPRTARKQMIALSGTAVQAAATITPSPTD